MRPRRLGGLALLTALAFPLSAHAQEEDDPPEAQDAPNPHGGATGAAGMFQPPPDTNDEDARVPGGAIAVTILDPDNHALPNTGVTLGILHQSVAKGESREHKLETTNADGNVLFSGLERGSGIAYRVMVSKDGGQFDAMPFALPLEKGMRVVLHVYPVAHDIEQAVVVTQIATFVELKDERVQFEEAVTILNVGRTAWAPSNLVLSLPERFTGFSTQQSMTDQGVDSIDTVGLKGVRLRGTFPPGQHTIDFRWQLPYDGEKSIQVDEGMPPHLFGARIIAAASHDMRLVATGFPEAEPSSMQGERVLVTEKQMRKGDPPLAHLHVELLDLPTPGPARLIATLLAALGVLGGFAIAFAAAAKDGPQTGARDLRARLLDELAELERGRASGDVGPKTYERARRALIDALARLLSGEDAAKATLAQGAKTGGAD